MANDGDQWVDRARKGLNRLLDRINSFESQGGVGAAVQRTVERVRREQERLRREMGQQGPVAYVAKIRQAYARLEVPFGSDWDVVRSSYRRLMRRYHPDRHTADVERERLATEISQKLTVAYDLLEKHLNR